MLNKDYKEMLQILLDNKVKFLIVGAYAMNAYGYPRSTGDFDIWVEASEANSVKIYRSLAKFGAPVGEINKKSFSEKKIVFQIGIAPRRIDIVTHIDGVHFKRAYKDKEQLGVDGIKLPFISKENLIKNKLSTGRQKDKLDAIELKKKEKGDVSILKR